MSARRTTVPPEDAGQRLDAWLAARWPDLSRARIQSLIAGGHVRADGASVRKNTRTTDGMQITLEEPPVRPTDLVAEPLPLEVLYEDEDLIVLNKPAGRVVHPAPGHERGTLVNALMHRWPDLGPIDGERRPGIVHRLDKDTSGVMVVARHETALRNLAAQFKGRVVRKEYTAIVQGVPEPRRGRVETLIGRSQADRKKMTARPRRGREARTAYEVVEPFGVASRVVVRIETGRTHQIRVHMSHIGHPVLGDRQYGRRRGEADLPFAVHRQMLHAARIGFEHPRDGRYMDIEAPLPRDMEEVLGALRKGRA